MWKEISKEDKAHYDKEVEKLSQWQRSHAADSSSHSPLVTASSHPLWSFLLFACTWFCRGEVLSSDGGVRSAVDAAIQEGRRPWQEAGRIGRRRRQQPRIRIQR